MNNDSLEQSIRERLLSFALNSGAGGADCISMRSQALDVSVRTGAREDAGRSESYGIGLRVFKGARQAYGSTADTSDEGLKTLAEQVCAMADVVPEDVHTRMAVRGEYATAFPGLDLDDASDIPDISTLTDMALQVENSALDVRGITNSDGAQAGWSRHVMGMTSTEGFNGAYAHSVRYVSCAVIGGKGDGMERDYASAQATYAQDLENLDEVGRRAAERTLARLNPRMGKTGSFPVLFERRVSASLLRSLSRATYGPRLAKKTSFLSGDLGELVCNKNITVIDDPFVMRGHRSSPFDGEGLAPKRHVMVDNGVLNGLYLDMRSASRLGLKSTAHAVRGLASPPSPAPSNLWIENGACSLDDMISQMGEGFVVTELMGANISLATGDYSRGASGFWVSGGKIVHPVAEMTIAGNLKDMFLNMQPADDLKKTSGVDAPSLLVDGMTVATRD